MSVSHARNAMMFHNGQKRPLHALLSVVLCLVLACVIAVLPGSAAAASTVTVFYRPSSAWTTVNIHYAPTGGAWTAVPGVPMASASCTGWYTRTLDLGTATTAQVVFNNASGTLGQQQRPQLQHRDRNRHRARRGRRHRRPVLHHAAARATAPPSSTTRSAATGPRSTSTTRRTASRGRPCPASAWTRRLRRLGQEDRQPRRCHRDAGRVQQQRRNVGQQQRQQLSPLGRYQHRARRRGHLQRGRPVRGRRRPTPPHPPSPPT